MPAAYAQGRAIQKTHNTSPPMNKYVYDKRKHTRNTQSTFYLSKEYLSVHGVHGHI